MLNQKNNRRDFLKKWSLSTAPFLLPGLKLNKMPGAQPKEPFATANKAPVNFLFDGLFFSPAEYLEKLGEIHRQQPIEQDIYMNGGATQQLEEAFAALTGKEKAIYLPTGTMANQLAIKLLNGENTKVIVPENAHVFRDEADAAQSVHNKRLIPIGRGKPHFDLADLEAAIAYLEEGEVFKSGLGTVVIECPVRRADGRAVPIEEIKEISAYCRQNGYKLHLDGARLHLASAYTKVPISEYASYFDTVYISLYKYLQAGGGAILCGEASLIDQIPHQIKIHGGTMFQSWLNTSMALHYLTGIEDRWEKTITAANELLATLSQSSSMSITKPENGTNIYHMKVGQNIDTKRLASFLQQEHHIRIRPADEQGNIRLAINESILNQPIPALVAAWKRGMEIAHY